MSEWKPDELRLILDRAAKFFSLNLLQSEADDCLQYMAARELTKATIERWSIGYAVDDWQGLLRETRARNLADSLLIEAGLASQSDSGRVYDRFRGRIMFPIRDVEGRTISFGGRIIKPKEDSSEPKYLNGSETLVFDKGAELYGLYEALTHGPLQKAIVVEGYFDVVLLDQNEIRGAVATMGTATSERHIEKLFSHTDVVIFCFDGDRAGLDAAKKALLATLPALLPGKQARFVFLPQGEDPDSFVRKHGKDAFLQQLADGEDCIDYLVRMVSEAKDVRSPTARKRLLEESSEFIAQIGSSDIRDDVVARIAKEALVDTRELGQMMPSRVSLRSTAPRPT